MLARRSREPGRSPSCIQRRYQKRPTVQQPHRWQQHRHRQLRRDVQVQLLARRGPMDHWQVRWGLPVPEPGRLTPHHGPSNRMVLRSPLTEPPRGESRPGCTWWAERSGGCWNGIGKICLDGWGGCAVTDWRPTCFYRNIVSPIGLRTQLLPPTPRAGHRTRQTFSAGWACGDVLPTYSH